MLDACKRAKIRQAISFHVFRHTHSSALAMRGVPLGVIAEQLGHADTRMTEKHYAHLAPSYVADTIRAHFPTLGIAGDTTVTPIPRKKGARDRSSATGIRDSTTRRHRSFTCNCGRPRTLGAQGGRSRAARR